MTARAKRTDGFTIEAIAENYVNGNLSDVARYFDNLGPDEAAFAALAVYLWLKRCNYPTERARFYRWLEGRLS